jgi:hypothetical protein
MMAACLVIFPILFIRSQCETLVGFLTASGKGRYDWNNLHMDKILILWICQCKWPHFLTSALTTDETCSVIDNLIYRIPMAMIVDAIHASWTAKFCIRVKVCRIFLCTKSILCDQTGDCFQMKMSDNTQIHNAFLVCHYFMADLISPNARESNSWTHFPEHFLVVSYSTWLP